MSSHRGAHNRLLKEQMYDVIIHLHKSGLTLDETGKKTGVSKERVRQILVNHGIYTRNYSNIKNRILYDSICDDYVGGIDASDICDKYSISRVSLAYILRQRDMKIHRKRKITDEIADNIVKLYISGKSMRQVASHFGVSYQTVFRLLKKRGISRGRKKLDQEKIDSILQLSADGYSCYQISKKVGVSYITVRKHVSKKEV